MLLASILAGVVLSISRSGAPAGLGPFQMVARPLARLPGRAAQHSLLVPATFSAGRPGHEHGANASISTSPSPACQLIMLKFLHLPDIEVAMGTDHTHVENLRYGAPLDKVLCESHACCLIQRRCDHRTCTQHGATVSAVRPCELREDGYVSTAKVLRHDADTDIHGYLA